MKWDESGECHITVTLEGKLSVVRIAPTDNDIFEVWMPGHGGSPGSLDARLVLRDDGRWYVLPATGVEMIFSEGDKAMMPFVEVNDAIRATINALIMGRGEAAARSAEPPSG